MQPYDLDDRESSRLLEADVQRYAKRRDGRVRVDTVAHGRVEGRLYRVESTGISVRGPLERRSKLLSADDLRRIEGWVPRWERLAAIVVLFLGIGAAIGAWGITPDPVVGRREHILLAGLGGAIVGALCAWIVQDLPQFGRWVVLMGDDEQSEARD